MTRGLRGSGGFGAAGAGALGIAFVVLGALFVSASGAARVSGAGRRQKQAAGAKEVKDARTLYRITLRLDFDARRYEGSESVSWTNRDDRPASFVYFHLYPNARAEDERAGVADAAAPEEPRLEVTGARAAGQTLALLPEDEGATLRVQLREPLAPGATVTLEVAFKGSVPELDPDETSLPAHVVQQVGAAMHDTREVRRARDTNFVSRGVMLLGSFFPVLAVRDEGGDWQRRVEATVGDTFFADSADYSLALSAPADVAVFTSGEESHAADSGHGLARTYVGANRRGFALVAGRTLRKEEREVGDLRVRSVFAAEHEKVGRRVLSVAADAARTFTSRFGALPIKTITVTEAPLVAGLGSAEFSGLAVIASAFYVDFDSPLIRALPEMVREQRASVEDSLEFAAAQGVAQQWWGEAVGSDPAREAVVDEALAQWSALLYVQDVHGEVRASEVQEDQLRGVYQIYRTFGGEDRAAGSPTREYRNSFQYAAIVATKGALMFVALRQLLGEAKFFKALRGYYEANRLEVAGLGDLRAAFVAEAELLQRRVVARTFDRWLTERRGDQDIAPPNPQLLAALGMTAEPSQTARDRNAFSRLGRFFWRQMTRIR
ncbi:MAG TPA: M1 family aminopeptidase [Pyrinomonadaceae bacterium]|nr:M1 family aminopeptidase [Pyrinomonadaceae bacterium]